jgi:hypothetical protein
MCVFRYGNFGPYLQQINNTRKIKIKCKISTAYTLDLGFIQETEKNNRIINPFCLLFYKFLRITRFFCLVFPGAIFYSLAMQ